MLSRLAFPLLGLVTAMGSGCSHYQLGPGREDLGFSTLYVAPVANEAAVPQAVATVSRELRTAFINDGRVQLVGQAGAADVTLELNLVDYGRSFTAVQPRDTALARKFDLVLTAECTLVDQRTGQTIFADRRILVTRQIFVDGGQSPAEYQAMPQLADQLADQAAHAVLDVW